MGPAAGRTVAANPALRRRATQTIPPALRREIVRRHHGRCAAPGCRQSGFVHQHHLIRRADGGGHEARALVDRAATHVGPDATAAELFRVATVAAGWRAWA